MVRHRKQIAPVRLWVKAVFTGYRRNYRSQKESQALVNIQGVNDKLAARWYQGKKACYIYKATNKKNNSKFRVIWGKVRRPHGNNGKVICSFRKNLPARAMGG